MTYEIALLVVQAVTLLLLGVGAWWFQRQLRGWSSSPREKPDEAPWRRDLDRLEDRWQLQLESALRVLEAQSRLWSDVARQPRPSLVSVGSRSGEESGESSASSETAEETSAPLPDSRSSSGPTLQPHHLDKLLRATLEQEEFLQRVWPSLHQDFHACRRRVAEALRHEGIVEVEIQPSPSLPDGNPKHWEFMVIRPRRWGEGAQAYLVPRPYTRYDPSFHGHLFETRDPVKEADVYFHRLIRCAAIVPDGDFSRTILEDQVVYPGKVHVEA